MTAHDVYGGASWRLLVGKRVFNDPQRRPGVSNPKRVPGFDQGPQHDLAAGFDPLNVLLQANALLAELAPQLLEFGNPCGVGGHARIV